jgi:NADH:flavin oxidoreductases, Old Yellow Enzyme family
MSILFNQLSIKSLTLKNRLVVSPMCQYSSEDGFANDWHLVHLGSRAVGGAAVVLTEATAVAPEGRISPFDLGIWKDEHVRGLKRITSFLTQQGSLPGIQLAHAGRKASHTKPLNGDKLLKPSEGGWKTVAPSSIPFSSETDLPEALTKESIAIVIEQFKNAAKRAFLAGFKIVEVHAAHGYLIHQFLSPLSNKRSDDYGGSFNNRIKLLIEIIEAVKTVWPSSLPIFVRISATDWHQDGWTIDDSVKLAGLLKQQGVDLIDASSGGIVPGVQIPVGPGYQAGFSEKIKTETGILTGAVGMITSPNQAENILEKHQADVILLGREFLRDPYFPLHAAHELNDTTEWPLQYQRAKLKQK